MNESLAADAIRQLYIAHCLGAKLYDLIREHQGQKQADTLLMLALSDTARKHADGHEIVPDRIFNAMPIHPALQGYAAAISRMRPAQGIADKLDEARRSRAYTKNRLFPASS